MSRAVARAREPEAFDKAKFARLVAEGVDHAEAMTAAGYAGANPKKAAAKALADESVLDLVQLEHRRFITSEVGPVARREHKRMLEDPATPASVKARLIAITFEYAMPEARGAAMHAPEPSVAELEARRDALLSEIATRYRRTIELKANVPTEDLFE